jgi:hypothetical protein
MSKILRKGMKRNKFQRVLLNKILSIVERGDEDLGAEVKEEGDRHMPALNVQVSSAWALQE